MKQNEYIALDGLAIAELIHKRELRPIEALDVAIRHIEKVQPQIGAICWPQFESARKHAISLEADRTPAGPFHGVPLLLKDALLEVADFPLTGGSRLLRGNISQEDSALAVRLRAAGFNFFGRTTSPEFGANAVTESVVYDAPTRNPWNLTFTPGGSSGGAAAAVAAGISPLAHASDGGGSIRIPASCCGLFGLKPTRMRNPVGRGGEGWGGLIVEHLVSRSVRDSAAVLDATQGTNIRTGYIPHAPTGTYLEHVRKPPNRLRIGLITRPPSGAGVDADCTAAAMQAALLCEHLGHSVEYAQFPATDYERFGRSMRLVVAVAAARTVEDACRRRGRAVTRDDLEESMFTATELAKRSSAIEY
ncbi:amidase [Paraburkholderia sp. GAS333]|uniref:amidase n=1 Tax=Paraburkholderia sp. GAS333 TaxID=3156279 RepID=UPI003D254B5F